SAGPANESTQTLTVTAVAPVADSTHGTVSLSAGQVTYTPDPDFNGPASFHYTVTDNGTTAGVNDFKSDTGTVNVTVTPVNDQPTTNASPSSLNIDEGASAQTIKLSASDVETHSGDLTFTITTAPAHGILRQDINVVTDGSTFTGSPTDVTYTPDSSFAGTDSVKFKVTDTGDPAG